jgi:hypothetical protein
MFSPSQIVELPEEIIEAVGGFCVLIVIMALSVPQLFIAVSVYVPATETSIVAAVDPEGAQEYEFPPEAFRFTEDAGQRSVDPEGVITAAGSGNCVIIILSDAVPQLLVDVTE